MSRTNLQGNGAVASRDDLRGVMRRWATGVTVVTIQSGPEARGATVNSFTSVSLEPPLILICLDTRARTHHLLLAAGRFCVNFLSEDQEDLSNRYAGRRSAEHGDFSAVSQQATASGTPILDGCLAWLDCELVDSHAAGDHTIFVALVREAQTVSEGNPLLHHAGQYHRLPR